MLLFLSIIPGGPWQGAVDGSCHAASLLLCLTLVISDAGRT